MALITDSVDRGLAVLIAESESGEYETVGVVSTTYEAWEAATEDLRGRMDKLDAGESPMCPYIYRLWARNAAGAYVPMWECRSEDTMA